MLPGAYSTATNSGALKMPDRFPTPPKSETAAINSLADRLVAAQARAIVTKSGATTTLTAAEMINAIYQQSGANGALGVTTATAAALVAALSGAQVGSAFEFIIVNTNNATITLTGGSGVTLSGTTAVPTNKSQIYRGIVTNATSGAEAVTLLGVLTAPV